jgi:hypothetical protein
MHVIAQMQTHSDSLGDAVAAEIIPASKEVIQSPLLHAAALEGIQEFFAVYARATKDSADKLVPELFRLLVRPGQTIPTAEDGGTQAFANIAKCIGTVVENSQTRAESIVAEFINAVKVCVHRYCMLLYTKFDMTHLYRLQQKGETGKDAQLYLSLLILGEIGRTK